MYTLACCSPGPQRVPPRYCCRLGRAACSGYPGHADHLPPPKSFLGFRSRLSGGCRPHPLGRMTTLWSASLGDDLLLAPWCLLHHGWCAWPGGWTVFRPLKQSGTFMPTPLDEGATTAGVPRHYAHSYERCRTPQPSFALPIPIRREVSDGARSLAKDPEGVHLIH